MGEHSIYAFAFVCNFIVGAGILSLPQAMQAAGLLAGGLFLAFVSIIAIITAMFVVESTGRACSIVAFQQLDVPTERTQLINTPAYTPVSPQSINALGGNAFDHSPSPASNAGGGSGRHREQQQAAATTSFLYRSSNVAINTFEVRDEYRFEVVALCDLFLGRWGRNFYQVSVLLFLFGAMWLYMAMASESLAATIPVYRLTSSLECVMSDVTGTWAGDEHTCQHVYYIWVGIFTALMIPLSLAGGTSQAVVQLTLTILMCSLIVLMIVSVVLKAYDEPYDGHHRLDLSTMTLSHRRHEAPFIVTPKLFEWKAFGQLFTTLIFSVMLQQGVPMFLARMPDKAKARAIFAAALSVIVILYISMCSTTVLYFGDEIDNPVTLNWAHMAETSSRRSVLHWLDYVIVFFPVISIAAAFPLYAISISDSVYAALPETWKLGHWLDQCMRVLLIVAAAGLALLEKNAASIIVWPGLFGFVLSFIAPSLLQIYSKRKSVELFGTSRSPYTRRCISSDVCAWLIFVFGLFGIVFSFVVILYKQIKR